jgi:autotransporter-associated beta strand protein
VGRSLTKAGAGTLALGGANTFSGGVTLSTGTLAVGNASAAGSGTLTLNTGTTIRADTAAVTLPNAVALAGDFTAGGSLDLTFSGPATLSGNRVLTISNSGITTFSGAIAQSGGTFGVTKTGAGTLAFSGSAANTYGGVTSVNAGTLVLAKGAPNGAIVGPSLVVGDGAGADVVRLDASDQIADATALTVNAGATLDLNGNSERINVVTLEGGTIASGAGTFTLGTSLTTLASASPGTISGNLDLNAATRTITVADGGATNDLQISAAISNGSLTKQGPGQLRLFGTVANTYTGTTTVNDGTLLLGKSVADGAIRGNLTINAGVARLAINEQILATAGNQVLVSQAQFDLVGFFETIQDLVLVGGSVTGGALTVLGSVSSLSSDVSASIS